MSKTCFKGTINGQEFDNVTDYNFKMQELLEAGVAITASSSTTIAADDNEACTVNNSNSSLVEQNDELSFYPYMDNDDPYYLDILVTDDSEINKEAYKEMLNYFGRCYKYIIDNVSNKSNSVDTLNTYRNDLRELINAFKSDYKYTEDAIISVKSKIDDLKRDFEEQLNNLTKQYNVLNDAKPVITEFVSYYEAVENEVINEINSRKTMDENRCTCGCNDENCKCNREDTVNTTVNEVVPQATLELSDIFDSVFGPGWFNNRKRMLV